MRIAAIAIALPWFASQLAQQLRQAGVDQLTTLSLIYVLSACLAALAWHERRRDPGLALPSEPVRHWLVLVATVTITFVIAATTSLATTDLGGDPQALDRSAAGVLAVAAGASIVPLAEELVFRGVIYQALRRRRIPEDTQRWPEGSHKLRALWLPITVSSLLFGLAHYEVASLTEMASLTVFGAALAIAYEFTGRLWIPILIHATFNLGAGFNSLDLPHIFASFTVVAMLAITAIVASCTGPPAPIGFIGSGRDLHPFRLPDPRDTDPETR